MWFAAAWHEMASDHPTLPRHASLNLNSLTEESSISSPLLPTPQPSRPVPRGEEPARAKPLQPQSRSASQVDTQFRPSRPLQPLQRVPRNREHPYGSAAAPEFKDVEMEGSDEGWSSALTMAKKQQAS